MIMTGASRQCTAASDVRSVTAFAARPRTVIALRDLGFPLQEIRVIVDEIVSLEELRGMLRLRQVEAKQRRDAENDRLLRVEARLRQIELEDGVSDYDIVVKRLEPLRVATLQ